jgi:oxygen-independent coproporphyrinogen III oxidase
MLGVYIHLPFCQSKCKYCDFNSITDIEYMQQYIDSLIKTIPLITDKFDLKEKSVDTIFFGGGSPSIFSIDDLAKILESIHKEFKIQNNSEISIEANPSSLSKKKLISYKSLGINRLSLGVQSLNNEILKCIGRRHTKEIAIRALNDSLNIFSNTSVDMMFGLSNQTVKEYTQDLEKLVKFHVPHISAYLLTLSENNFKKFKNLPSPKTIPLFFKETKEILEENGIFQYEISNYSKKNKECRHNLKYWKNNFYISFGAGAHSFISHKTGLVRFENEKNILNFIAKAKEGTTNFSMYETLSQKDHKIDFITSRLRLNEGLSFSKYRELFNSDFLKEHEKAIAKNLFDQNIDIYAEKIVLTEKGRLFSNQIFLDFV